MQSDDDLIREYFDAEYVPGQGDPLLTFLVVGGLCALVGYIIGAGI